MAKFLLFLVGQLKINFNFFHSNVFATSGFCLISFTLGDNHVGTTATLT